MYFLAFQYRSTCTGVWAYLECRKLCLHSMLESLWHMQKDLAERVKTDDSFWTLGEPLSSHI